MVESPPPLPTSLIPSVDTEPVPSDDEMANTLFDKTSMYGFLHGNAILVTDDSKGVSNFDVKPGQVYALSRCFLHGSHSYSEIKFRVVVSRAFDMDAVKVGVTEANEIDVEGRTIAISATGRCWYGNRPNSLVDQTAGSILPSDETVTIDIWANIQTQIVTWIAKRFDGSRICEHRIHLTRQSNTTHDRWRSIRLFVCLTNPYDHVHMLEESRK